MIVLSQNHKETDFIELGGGFVIRWWCYDTVV